MSYFRFFKDRKRGAAFAAPLSLYPPVRPAFCLKGRAEIRAFVCPA
ncbi:hypothetical protein GCWU000341_00158 [Oribacterium sp. oral taxon 078 str. F0262]|nr:hypothetical protein GCWU000341_00158 [Oribacterium sp. oral taxon 078 str. F0262]